MTSTENLTPPEDLVAVARTAGAYGVRGWVRVVLLGTGEALVQTGDWWFVSLRGEKRALTPEDIKTHGDVLLVKFEEITNKEDADKLRGQIAIPRSEFPDLNEGEHWVTDLEGCRVVNNAGVDLGTVDCVVDNGGQSVLKILFEADGKKKTRLIPMVPAYVENVDTESSIITVDWDPEWD